MLKNELLANLAKDYYVNRLNLAELAEKYHISRYLVNQALDKARQQGIVTFSIQSPTARNWNLENDLQQLSAIPNIYVLKDSNDAALNMDILTRYAAQKIEEKLQHCHIVGTAWGSTVYNVITKFERRSLPDLQFVQFIGENMKYNSAVGSARMVEYAANQFSSNYSTLSGPLYILNDETRHGMLQEIATQETIKKAQRMEMIFTGIGTLHSVKSIPIWWRNRQQIFAQVDLNQVAGMAYGRPYDINGHFLNPETDKTFGLDLETILQTPTRFGIIDSKFKVEALLGALRGKLFTHIITNESVARRALYELTK
ncbi:sugar-binding transcriptional regulator [Bombilactobacillus thymidiniphilus]|uniref:Sugar-binding transcriptional regulator n=1 Tax=Bombilactobacillus thymidiniphilus TaxID=2923363 RepID=A0ABY4PBY9_9LACO|nr:sugar-binding domain-containing protein [Bombilactobacillus thymidiniphilus]UQS83159.1 sugar-binding transcriptional regulator [Bombilactobacillus thymidiniphilus]